MTQRACRISASAFAIALLAIATTGCKKNTPPARPASTRIDPNGWTADPALPKPDLVSTIEIIKEPERKKISMKITVLESHGLNVQDVQVHIHYRSFNEETKQWVDDPKRQVRKLVLLVSSGEGILKTAIVEDNLKEVAWESENTNWRVEVEKYGPYYE